MDSIVENSMIIVGISARVENPVDAAEKLGELWGRFWESEIGEQIPNKLNDTIYSVYHGYEGNFTQAYTTTVGFRLDAATDLPEGFDVVEIPEQKYKVFTSSGKQPDALVDVWGQIWEADKTLNRAYTFDFEVYDERAQDANDGIVDIYIALK